MNNSAVDSIKKYELLILDYGGTYSFEYKPAENFDKIMRGTFGRLPTKAEIDRISPVSRRFAANNLTTMAYISKIADIMACTVPTVDEFEANTIAVTSPPSSAMRALVETVRVGGIKVSLLSNMYAFEVAKTKLSGRYDGFDFLAFSATSGLTKSDPAFFEETLSHFGVAAENTLFVDDIEEYTRVAHEVGIATLYADQTHFQSAEELAEAIASEIWRAS